MHQMGYNLAKQIMNYKNTIIALAILTTAIFPTSSCIAQGWGEILWGVGSALLEKHIDNSSSYSSQEKESMRNNINTINNAVNVNQNARNATKDAYQGNYTGAVIQGTQTITNATGNHQYDTYLNSANHINKANREFEQDIQNGIDKDAALDKRNTTIGYSVAESAIELQDRIARERLENARQQRIIEQQAWEIDNNYTAHDNNESTNAATNNLNAHSDVFIAHINTSVVLDAMPDKARAEKDLEMFYGELQNQLQTLYNEYQNKLQYYKSNQATMSNLTKQTKEKEIIDLESRIKQFQEGAESEYNAKRAELLKPILEKIQDAINNVASEYSLTYVIDISTGAAVFLGEDSIDITYMVLKKLGI